MDFNEYRFFCVTTVFAHAGTHQSMPIGPICDTLLSTGTVDWMHLDQDVPYRIFMDSVSDFNNASIFCTRLKSPTSVSTNSGTCHTDTARNRSPLWGIFGTDPRTMDADESRAVRSALVTWMCDEVSTLLRGNTGRGSG